MTPDDFYIGWRDVLVVTAEFVGMSEGELKWARQKGGLRFKKFGVGGRKNYYSCQSLAEFLGVDPAKLIALAKAKARR